MASIYITHYSAKKDDQLKDSGEVVTPDNLNKATPLRRFIKICKIKNANWAIFSDKYGVVFPWEKIEWYEKPPDSVTKEEYHLLLDNLITRFSEFNEVWFYHNPGRFHNLYKKINVEATLKGMNIKMFSHIAEIRK